MTFSTSAEVLRPEVETRVAGGLTVRPEGITIFSSAILKGLGVAKKRVREFVVSQASYGRPVEEKACSVKPKTLRSSDTKRSCQLFCLCGLMR